MTLSVNGGPKVRVRLMPGEAILLKKVRNAGPEGLVWGSHDSRCGSVLIRRGLATCYRGPIVDDGCGRRTGMRLVAVGEPEIEAQETAGRGRR